MAMKRLFNLVMIIFMVSLVIEKERMVKVAEAGNFCWRPSQLFHGICVRDKNCQVICEKEGFVIGECKGIINRMCMCGSDCGGGSGSGNPPPGEGFPPQVEAAAKIPQNNTSTLS